MNEEESIDLFISYSHKDGGVARDLIAKLEKVGLKCFIAEQDIRAGELWEPRIRKALTKAKKVLLILTPRSKNSLWVAAEAGAAWVLEKELIAGLLFVESDNLFDTIRRHQARRIESQDQVDSLIAELAPSNKTKEYSAELTGQWIDPVDGDMAYFRQIGNRVVGFYDYGSGSQKVGMYMGTSVTRHPLLTTKSTKNTRKNTENFVIFVSFVVNSCGFGLFSVKNEDIRARRVALYGNYR